MLIIGKSLDASAEGTEVECPCNYFASVPMTTGCWGAGLFNELAVMYSDDFDQPMFRRCAVVNVVIEPFQLLLLLVTGEGEGEPATCEVFFTDPPIPNEGCAPPNPFIVADLTPEEVRACQCDLLAYTTALNGVEGITVSGGPPYVCGNVDCTPPPPIITTPIPTLSEYGMIITAGVLGLLAMIGLFIMRRRKAVA